MTSMDQRRRDRVRNGSRRKRDLEAVVDRPDWDAFIAEHFPDEHHGYAYSAAMRIYLAKPKRDRSMPAPAEVREQMRLRGWLRESLESTCQ